jgi:hypothetical protein
VSKHLDDEAGFQGNGLGQMLDARVYCNCIESGKLRVQPKPHWRVEILDDGDVEATCKDESEARELARWWQTACEHTDRELLNHSLGNIGTVAFLREELRRVADKCPLILGRVVYDGIHSGDFLTVEQVRDLEKELCELEGFQCENKADQTLLNRFLAQMRELVAAALSVDKPIAF